MSAHSRGRVLAACTALGVGSQLAFVSSLGYLTYWCFCTVANWDLGEPLRFALFFIALHDLTDEPFGHGLGGWEFAAVANALAWTGAIFVAVLVATYAKGR